MPPELVDWADFFTLAWNRLPLEGTSAAATASAIFISSTLLAVLKIKFYNNICLDFEYPILIGDRQATAKFKVSGLNSSQLPEALTFARDIVTIEAERTQPLPNSPNVPTPDNVEIRAPPNALSAEIRSNDVPQRNS